MKYHHISLIFINCAHRLVVIKIEVMVDIKLAKMDEQIVIENWAILKRLRIEVWAIYCMEVEYKLLNLV